MLYSYSQQFEEALQQKRWRANQSEIFLLRSWLIWDSQFWRSVLSVAFPLLDQDLTIAFTIIILPLSTEPQSLDVSCSVLEELESVDEISSSGFNIEWHHPLQDSSSHDCLLPKTSTIICATPGALYDSKNLMLPTVQVCVWGSAYHYQWQLDWIV